MICFWTSISISQIPCEIDQFGAGILDGDFDKGVFGIFGKFTSRGDPDGAVIRLNHLIAVGRGRRLRVEN